MEWQERILNDGSRWQVYKRYFEPDALADELGGGRTLFAGRWFVAVRCLTRAALELSLASRRSSATTGSAAPASKPATRSSRCRSSSPTRASARTCSARRRASSKGEERRPWRGRAGRTLRRWLELEEDEFYATFYCASVTRCYPGKAPSGEATGRRRRESRSSARSGATGSSS